MSKQKPLRLFLDYNVLTGGIIAEWGLDKAVLSLCAARILWGQAMPRGFVSGAVGDEEEVSRSVLLGRAHLSGRAGAAAIAGLNG
ncbi:MAG: hypothetical protein ACREEM_09050 [Blastocatellia bacterium]